VGGVVVRVRICRLRVCDDVTSDHEPHVHVNMNVSTVMFATGGARISTRGAHWWRDGNWSGHIPGHQPRHR
jgi:hypothetical protein